MPVERNFSYKSEFIPDKKIETKSICSTINKKCTISDRCRNLKKSFLMYQIA